MVRKKIYGVKRQRLMGYVNPYSQQTKPVQVTAIVNSLGRADTTKQDKTADTYVPSSLAGNGEQGGESGNTSQSASFQDTHLIHPAHHYWIEIPDNVAKVLIARGVLKLSPLEKFVNKYGLDWRQGG